ncbi:MAG: EAL domain-containing protein [Mycobacteriales bacterium]|nr:EAL domain-containing protein [Mycobacteriales bacterium]
MSTDGQVVPLVRSLGEPVATLLALLAARTRVRTWVVTANGRVAAATGPHAPPTGSAWTPAGDAVSVALPGAAGHELGRLSAVGGPVHDEDLVRLVAVSVAALVEAAGLGRATDRTDIDAEIDDLLDFVRERLRVSAAFLSRFVGDQRVLRSLVTAEGATRGQVEPLTATLCARIASGRLPALVPDVRAHPDAADLPALAQSGVRTYLGVPVELSDGSLYGTVCAATHEVRPDLDERAVDLLRIVARSVVRLLEREIASERRATSTSRAVAAVLAAGGPRMVFQAAVPIGGEGRGFLEALSRFDDGRPPDVWFREATAAGLGVELEVAAARGGLQALRPGVDVSVNLSAATITSGALPGLLDGLPLSQVVVEVSEHEAVRDYAELGAALEPHRRAGLRLAVDDAGAGYASLRHVVRLAPDVIKLDMSLVSGIDTDPSRRELAGALTSFAHRTGAVVVAEGVERRSEHEALREVGVDLGQGYLYAVPAPLGHPA